MQTQLCSNWTLWGGMETEDRGMGVDNTLVGGLKSAQRPKREIERRSLLWRRAWRVSSGGRGVSAKER